MSLIQSAKLNGLDPHAYLKDLLQRLPTHKARLVGELLPHRWQPAPSDNCTPLCQGCNRGCLRLSSRRFIDQPGRLSMVLNKRLEFVCRQGLAEPVALHLIASVLAQPCRSSTGAPRLQSTMVDSMPTAHGPPSTMSSSSPNSSIEEECRKGLRSSGLGESVGALLELILAADRRR